LRNHFIIKLTDIRLCQSTKGILKRQIKGQALFPRLNLFANINIKKRGLITVRIRPRKKQKVEKQPSLSPFASVIMEPADSEMVDLTLENTDSSSNSGLEI